MYVCMYDCRYVFVMTAAVPRLGHAAERRGVRVYVCMCDAMYVCVMYVCMYV
jgi:hypothetical protein